MFIFQGVSGRDSKIPGFNDTVVSSTNNPLMAYFIVPNKILFFFPVSQIGFNKEGPKPVMLHKNICQGNIKWNLCMD